MSTFRNLILQQKKEEKPCITAILELTNSTTTSFINSTYSSFNQTKWVKVNGELIDSPGVKRTLSAGIYEVEIKLNYNSYVLECVLSGTLYKSIDISNVDWSKWSSTEFLRFQGCINLKSIDLSSVNLFKIPNVTSLQSLFQKCTNLESIIWGDNWNCYRITNLSSLFLQCKLFKELDLSWFNISKNTITCPQMFEEMSNVTKIKLPKMKIDGREYKGHFLFESDKKLEEVDLSGITIINGAYEWFRYCNSLKTVKVIGCDDTTIGYVQSMLPEGTWTLTDGVFTKS